MKGGPWCGAVYKEYERPGMGDLKVWYAYPWSMEYPWVFLTVELVRLRDQIRREAERRKIRTDCRILLFPGRKPPRSFWEIDWKNG